MEKYCRSLCLLIIFILVRSGEGQLVPNFYGSRCPNVEGIVRQVVLAKINQTFVTIPATVRLFFHDCFVEVLSLIHNETHWAITKQVFLVLYFSSVLYLQGCDASVLIASPNNDAEKDAPDNLSLAGDGFDTVVKAKQAVEAQCPGVVSCADILVIAARDVVLLVIIYHNLHILLQKSHTYICWFRQGVPHIA